MIFGARCARGLVGSRRSLSSKKRTQPSDVRRFRRAAGHRLGDRAVVLTWWLGTYPIPFGAALLVLAFKLRARKTDAPRAAAPQAA